YESNIVDKNGIKINLGDWIKESWYFHGFCGSGGNFPFDAQEYVNKNKSFRFVQYNYSVRFGIDRVKRQGWPVSEYEIEIVTKEEVEKIKNDNAYISSENKPYSTKPYYYRVREEWDK
ncbi:MAG: hypothetical protein AABY22_34060, partial [Nanoarchaeota archaeon]